MAFTRPGNGEDGYGEQDRQMAGSLRSAASQREADQIARGNGLADADDAANWLRERS